MSEAADGVTPSRPAWQPFTFGGVAVFAQSGAGQLLLMELVVALLAGICVVFFLQHACAPVVLQAIQEMPESAKIDHGRLTGIATTVVAGNKLLAIAITPETSGDIGQSADMQLQLRPANFRMGSVFLPDWGWEFQYGPDWTVDMSRAYLEPWWGAWRPVLLTAAGVAGVAALFVIWAALALIYTLPVLGFAWFADRAMGWDRAWRLASAALMPGALLMNLAILLYATESIDLVGLISFCAAHFIVGWVYAFGGALACPRLGPSPLRHNPFMP